MNYLRDALSTATPQSEPLPGQVPDSAGGYVWKVDPFERLRRFLVLGSEGGSYYASERDLTRENVTCIGECVATDGPKTVETIRAISTAGRAPKNDPALFALAACAGSTDLETRRAAMRVLPEVARTGT